MKKYGAAAAWILLALGNVVFLIYDIALTRLITLYMLKWRKSFKGYLNHKQNFFTLVSLFKRENMSYNIKKHFGG